VTAPTDPSPAPARLPLSAVVMAVVLFVFSLVLNTRHNDFAYSYHPDEAGKTGQVIGGSRNYHHPLLMLSVSDIVSRVSFLPREPQTVVEIGRWVSAAFAAGAVVALALLARLRYGALAGWGAGVAVALQVDLFETAHYMKEDPALLFGLALSLFAAQVWWSQPNTRTLRFFAIACGIAVSGKYLGVIALLFALPLVIWARHAEPALDRRTRLKRFGAASALTFLICNLPLFALKLSSPFRSIRNEMRGVAGGHRGITREIPHGEYLETLRENVPAVILILAALYVIDTLIRFRRRSAVEWATMLLPLGYLAAISCSPKIADRYLLPVNVLLPFFAVLSAAELARGCDSEKLRWRRILSQFVFAALTGWIAYAQWPAFRRSYDGFTHDDPAAVAEWIKTNLPLDAVIAEDHRVNLSPTKANGVSKNARVPQKVYNANFAPDLGTLDELRAKGVTHVAICRQSYGRYFKDETRPREGTKTTFDKRQEFYAQVLEQGELVHEWPSGTISYLQPGIKLFRVAPAK
jgi:4-amino-4-deoxy-L-arabinose transferase-like glycosyltransferase